MKRPSLMDKDFHYTSAAETDIRKLFRRVKRELREAEAVRKAPNIKPIKEKRRG